MRVILKTSPGDSGGTYLKPSTLDAVRGGSHIEASLDYCGDLKENAPPKGVALLGDGALLEHV